MNGDRRSPLNQATKQASVDSGFPGRHRPNPFDSDDESENKQRIISSKRTAGPPLATRTVGSNPFDDDDNNSGSSASSYSLSSGRSRYKNDFRDAGGLENQTVQELEKLFCLQGWRNNYSVFVSLEESILSVSLDYQCEIESMKIEMMTFEQSCFEANKIQEAAQENGRLAQLIQDMERSDSGL